MQNSVARGKVAESQRYGGVGLATFSFGSVRLRQNDCRPEAFSALKEVMLSPVDAALPLHPIPFYEAVEMLRQAQHDGLINREQPEESNQMERN
jgi:hypothetical protein